MKSKFRLSEQQRGILNGYAFILPALIFMIALIGYPTIYNFIISFQDATAQAIASNSHQFIGFDNYRSIFSDSLLKQSFINTFLYTIGCLAFQFSIGFILALFFCKKFPLCKIIRGLVVISWMLPVTVTALIFKFMFSEGNGIINQILMNMHFIQQPVSWLTNGGTAMWSLIIANSWIGIPFNMLLLTTGLNNIPVDVMEAASIDGANGIQKFFRITIPLLKPTMMSVLVLGFVYTFKVFDLVFVMTSGGPVDSTQVLSTYSYKLSFSYFRFGEGAAAANILFLCLFVVALIYLKLVSDDEVM
ncbi:carbohydrate ABC transporter permease [Caproicibacter fermentans]|uniref:Sugar ABC transporter permease n=1 Tax=Caproicibacter fermentans TaxID=2576756 RepID=A0A7G8TFQ1_9FIRM|nr:sugar ABC transporter permease [Caproicibacter fermentans]QNK42442.1 sugar ABC transporter permease [Caproicibacter fermentans]